jgi:hypothetical protein
MTGVGNGEAENGTTGWLQLDTGETVKTYSYYVKDVAAMIVFILMMIAGVGATIISLVLAVFTHGLGLLGLLLGIPLWAAANKFIDWWIDKKIYG